MFTKTNTLRTSGVTSKAASQGHFKTGQLQTIIQDNIVLPRRVLFWQVQFDAAPPFSIRPEMLVGVMRAPPRSSVGPDSSLHLPVEEGEPEE